MRTGLNGQAIVTADIIRYLHNTVNVEQINSMQLFVVDNTYLYSYRTLIGVFTGGNWFITTKRYSNTTSKQISKFSRLVGLEYINRVEQEQLEQLVDNLQ